MGHIYIILSAYFWGNRSREKGSETKTEMTIVGLNSYSSKTNLWSRIKVSNLEAPGHAISAPKIKLRRFHHFFFYWDFRDALC